MVKITGAMVMQALLVMAGLSCGQRELAQGAGTTALSTEGVPAGVMHDLDCATIMEKVKDDCDGFVAVAPGPGIRPELHYRPAEVIACMEGDSVADLRKRAAPYASSEEYVLMVPRAILLSDQEHQGQEFLTYLDQGLRSDLFEVIGPDTIPCAFSHMESSAASAPDVTVLLGFDRPQDGSERTVLLRDREDFFGGDLHFTFKHGAFKTYHRLVTSDQG